MRSFHVANVTGETLKPILAAHVDAATMINTDDHGAYSKLDRHFAGHEKVSHSVREYARRTPQGLVTTNTAEGFFSILKRGLNGIYHHVSEQHLQRYVTEFDFRYNNREALGVDDDQRAAQVVKQISGKRLTYRRINAKAR